MAAEAVLPPETALPAADPAIEASTDATDAAHWEAVARRTRSVASQWRKLHVNEEAKCEAARSTAARAINALRKAEDERDRAQRRAEAAEKALAAAKAEKQQWRARCEMQTASRTFVELSDARASLDERSQELASVRRELIVTRREFDEYRASQERLDAARKEAALHQSERLSQERENTNGEAASLQQEVDALRAELSEQLASSPPGALEAARAALAKRNATIHQLELKCQRAQAEAARWRERTRGAVASERLSQLRGGLAGSMVSPRLVAPPPLALLAGSNRDARGGEASGGAVAEADDPFRLRAERDW